MKTLQLITLATTIAASNVSPIHAQGTNVPLSLFINGGGSVSPLTNGELLEVGQSYNMVATPDAGYAFSNWQPVNVFTFTNFVTDTNGNTVPVVSTTASPMPPYTNQASLHFIMQPVVLIYDNPGVGTITEGSGWQANFEPILLKIQFGDALLGRFPFKGVFRPRSASPATGSHSCHRQEQEKLIAAVFA